jgi:L-aminopeptidase/D-esterase-like protein
MPGLRIGHATDAAAGTGCTVLLGSFRAAAELFGMATGTRELDVLQPLHIVPRIDGLLLTGGSAFGLDAAQGVVSWLEERGVGFDTGVARVPIVPAAVIFDLGTGRADRRPDAAMGRLACENAREDNDAEGLVGAGTGATVGKVRGREHGMPGGLGLSGRSTPAWRVLALTVVNALGDVYDTHGGIVAGARADDGTFADAAALLVRGEARRSWASAPSAGTNTTLAAIVTDAPLDRVGLSRLARMAATALARRISPVWTPFDGDVVFALTTATEEQAFDAGDVLMLGAAATAALEDAIVRAVTAGR